MKLQKLQAIKAKTQKGFTLIELMITVAIVGILAAVALPAYQDYSIRAQVSEGMQLAGGVQTAEAEYYSNNGSYADLTTLGITAPTGKYVSGITVTSAAGAAEATLQVAYANAAANSQLQADVLTFTSVTDANGNVHWSCGGTGTTVPKKWLPSSCTAN
jgi:type IV pilus assembly protein PilA